MKEVYNCSLKLTLSTLVPLPMDGVQQSQGNRATMTRQFTFYHSVPRSFWCSFDGHRKDERLSRPWRYSVVLTHGLWIGNPVLSPG